TPSKSLKTMSGNRLGPAAHSAAANKSMAQKTLIRPRNIIEEYTERSPKKELNSRVRNRKDPRQKNVETQKWNPKPWNPRIGWVMALHPDISVSHFSGSPLSVLLRCSPPEFCWFAPNNRA